MESDHGKLFIGGISWDTDEDRLREYFSNYGEVVEVVIMKDRITGRARGFGFIVFVDPAVAERVVMERHFIDGRMVEAKKAVPRDDQNSLNRNNNTVHGSPLPIRTKKIFVGGLPSTITVADFKSYFLQFGPISDAMVMYDHTTQRPRGFGFITFELEDAVDKVLFNTFHELNGKMVEVKRAVPKELSPGPTMRSPAVGYNYGIGMNRINSFINGYSQAFCPTALGGYNMKMDARLNTVSSGQNGFPAISPGYGIGTNFEPGFNSSFGVNSNYDSGVGYGRGLDPYYNGDSSRFNSSVGYGGGHLGAGAGITSMSRNVWSNGGLNYLTNSANSNAYITTGNGTLGGFGNGSLNVGASSSFISAQAGGGNAGYATGNLGFGSGENTFGIGGSGFGRNSAVGALVSPNAPNDGYEGTYAGLYGSNSVYGDPTWQSESNELDGSGPLGHGFDSELSDLTTKGAAGYMNNYGFASRQQNRGIAA